MAIDQLIPDVYDEAIKEAGIEPLGKAQVESAELQDDQSLMFKAVVSVKPEVKLSEYRNLKVTRSASTISPEQVEGELKKLQDQRGEYLPVLDRGVEEGDLVVVDYQMSIGGEIQPEAALRVIPWRWDRTPFFRNSMRG